MIGNPRDLQISLLQNQQRPGFQHQNTNRQYQIQGPGGENPLDDDVQGRVKKRTHLIQLHTHDPDEGPRLISDFHPSGVPIMVIVDPPSCCYLKLNIPHGIVSLEQVWGKHTGMMTPGYHCCYCSYKRIAAMITKNSIQFNTPIETCPTKDNVRVSVDIAITFHIGQEGTRDKDCENFLYYLGANRLEELLEQESEESIRNFVRRYKVDQIRDIKSEMTQTMKDELNKKFNSLGVYIEKVNVTNVIIPKDLRVALQQATAYDVFLQNQVKFQENVKLRMMNQENKTLQTLKRENDKKMLELNNQLAMEQIFLEKFKVTAETDQIIAIIKAKQYQEVKLIQATATKTLAEKRAKKQAESIIAEAVAYAEAKNINVDMKKQNLRKNAETRLEVAKMRSQGQIKEAEAEESNATSMAQKRKYEQKMKKSGNLRMLMKDKNIIIGGKNSEDLLGYFDETCKLVDEEDQKNSNDPEAERQRKNIKLSLEQDKRENKQKFEDPFFIKIEEASKHQNMKIVKPKRQDDETPLSDEESKDKKKVRPSSSQDQNSALSRPSIRNQGTVIEATEEEESSPQLKGKKDKHQTRNTKDSTKAIIKFKESFPSESENYEKISDDTPKKVKSLPQLVKLDVNLDTLKNFLEDIQEAINDHAKTIGVLQTDLKRKATEKTMSHYFLKISEGLHKECGERPHAIRLDNDQQNFLSENFQTEDSISLKKQAEKLQEKLEIIGLNLINLTKFRGTTEDRLEKLERIMPKCFTIDQFREESQAQEQRTLSYINDRLGTFQENLNGYKKELNDALTFFEKKVNDNQSETLWRIKDCEELLRSRVSNKYVDDAVKAVEEKVNKTLAYNEDKALERLEKSFKELGLRVQQTNTFFNEKFDDLRKVMAQYEGRIQNFATNEKLANVQTGYRDMKHNLERELELLQEHVKETKDKIGELNKRFSNLEIATSSLANGGDFSYQVLTHQAQQHQHQQQHSNSGTSRNQNLHTNDKQNKSTHSQKKMASPDPKDKLDPPHQHATLGQSPPQHSFSPLMRKRQNRAADSAFQAELDRRIQQSEELLESMEAKVESLKKQLDDKVTREEVKKLTSDKLTKEDIEHIIPNEEISQEKMKYLIRDVIENLSTKIAEQFKQFDNKMIRLRAEVDIHSVMRQLERKANEEQVRSDFSNHEFKISTLDRNIIRMAQDFETFQLAINKIHSAIVELQEANRDVLLGKKATNCLSCGKGGDVVQTVKGKDGKFYKASEHEKTKLSQDDSNIIGNYMYEIHTPLTGGAQQMQYGSMNDINSQYDFYKMRPSHSFYDSGIYDNQNQSSINPQNLPSVHRKKNSYGNNINILKSMASHAGINTGSNTQAQSVSFSHSNKRKLPFGFQVQQEKKELFKVGPRGKSSHTNYRQRPDSASNRDTNAAFSFNHALSDQL